MSITEKKILLLFSYVFFFNNLC